MDSAKPPLPSPAGNRARLIRYPSADNSTNARVSNYTDKNKQDSQVSGSKRPLSLTSDNDSVDQKIKNKVLNEVNFGERKYDYLSKVGKGKFSVVYKAISGTTVRAIKEYTDIVTSRDKVEGEVSLLQSLDHPNIIKHYGNFSGPNGQLCIELEWADGGDLKQMLQRHQSKERYFREDDIWYFLVQIARGVNYMHSKRIIHRDLKPANILLFRDHSLKIADFGLGKEVDSLQLLHSVVGTPLYMAPEVLSSNGYSFSSDIWSMGCIVYELCCLVSPFRRETHNGKEGLVDDIKALLQRTSKADYQPIPSPQYSTSIRNLVKDMLTPDPSARLDCKKVLDIAEEVVAELPKAHNPAPPTEALNQTGQHVLQNSARPRPHQITIPGRSHHVNEVSSASAASPAGSAFIHQNSSDRKSAPISDMQSPHSVNAQSCRRQGSSSSGHSIPGTQPVELMTQESHPQHYSPRLRPPTLMIPTQSNTFYLKSPQSADMFIQSTSSPSKYRIRRSSIESRSITPTASLQSPHGLSIPVRLSPRNSVLVPGSPKSADILSMTATSVTSPHGYSTYAPRSKFSHLVSTATVPNSPKSAQPCFLRSPSSTRFSYSSYRPTTVQIPTSPKSAQPLFPNSPRLARLVPKSPKGYTPKSPQTFSVTPQGPVQSSSLVPDAASPTPRLEEHHKHTSAPVVMNSINKEKNSPTDGKNDGEDDDKRKNNEGARSRGAFQHLSVVTDMQTLSKVNHDDINNSPSIRPHPRVRSSSMDSIGLREGNSPSLSTNSPTLHRNRTIIDHTARSAIPISNIVSRYKESHSAHAFSSNKTVGMRDVMAEPKTAGPLPSRKSHVHPLYSSFEKLKGPNSQIGPESGSATILARIKVSVAMIEGEERYKKSASEPASQVIGRGSFGQVYREFDKVLGVSVAMKRIEINNDQYEAVSQMEKEIKMLSELSHPNLVKYIGAWQTNEHLNIVLEYCSEGSIANILRSHSLPVKLIQLYTKQLVDALVYLHSHDVIHRDIKGGNVLLHNNGSEAIIKLADFGCSKDLKVPSVTNERMRGTIPWMAPEVAGSRETVTASDIWSLGATVIEMTTTCHPWKGEGDYEAGLLFTIAGTTKPPPFPKELPPSGISFLEACMAVDPSKRFSAEKLVSHEFLILDRVVEVSAPVVGRSVDTVEIATSVSRS